MVDQTIGILGATSLTGQCLLPLLNQAQYQSFAFSRTPPSRMEKSVSWYRITPESNIERNETLPEIPTWICLAPIWVLSDYFDFFLSYGARRIVALSSTSVFSKEASTSPEERSLSARLLAAEHSFQQWAEANNIEWIILRPTLIYGRGRDQNIGQITRLIQHYGFFPVFGPANGLRQPIHAEDVASASLLALQAKTVANCSYNISGGETLTYQAMLLRIFQALNKKPRLICIPLPLFRFAVFAGNLLTRSHRWTTAMATRMNQDLVFDHQDAQNDFGFDPRPFEISRQDIP